MMRKLGCALLLFAAYLGSAQAGFVDFFNGVTLGAKLPPHDLHFMAASPPASATLTLIDFWATWCEPCRDSIPKFNALYKKFGPNGLAVVGVSKEPQEVVQTFLDKVAMDYPHAIEGQMSLHKSLGVKALPYAVFVDSEGLIVWRGQPSEINEALIESLFKKHKAGQSTGASPSKQGALG